MYLLCFTKVETLYQNLLWFSPMVVSCGWRQDVLCQRRACVVNSARAHGPWPTWAEDSRRALRWQRTARRKPQETDKSNNMKQGFGVPIFMKRRKCFSTASLCKHWESPIIGHSVVPSIIYQMATLIFCGFWHFLDFVCIHLPIHIKLIWKVK